MQAVKGGLYPVNYLKMINEVFGYELNTIEVCSNSVSKNNAYTVDINPERNPVSVDSGEVLEKIQSNFFDRWRCDPPYNEKTAAEMYNTSLPDVGKLLKAASRICREGAILFLLLGPVNRQACPTGIKRIGWIPISVIPSNELRCLHIYTKISTCNVSMLAKNLQESLEKEVIQKV